MKNTRFSGKTLGLGVAPLMIQTGKGGSCRRDIVRGKEVFRRDTREKIMARYIHAWLHFTQIIMASEISFPKSFHE